jgi:hypothetical protein
MKTRHVSDDIPQKEHTEIVLAVERKGLVNQQPPACTKRKAFDVFVLRQIGRRAENLRHGGLSGVANREAADLA